MSSVPNVFVLFVCLFNKKVRAREGLRTGAITNARNRNMCPRAPVLSKLCCPPPAVSEEALEALAGTVVPQLDSTGPSQGPAWGQSEQPQNYLVGEIIFQPNPVV